MTPASDTARRCVDQGDLCPTCEPGGRCEWDWPTDIRDALRFDPFGFTALDGSFWQRPPQPSES